MFAHGLKVLPYPLHIPRYHKARAFLDQFSNFFGEADSELIQYGHTPCFALGERSEMKRISLVLSLMGFAVASHASFELLLQIDRVPNAYQIKRFDPMSGTYLGSFGQGWLTDPQNLVLRNGVLYVLDTMSRTASGGGRIHKFNPNTGELLGTVVLPANWGKVGNGSSLQIDSGGNFYVSDAQGTANSSFVNKYTPTGGYIGFGYWPPSGSTNVTGVVLNETANRLYLSSLNNATIEVYNTTTQTGVLQTISSPGGALYLVRNNNYLYYTLNFGSPSIFRGAINGDGSLGAFTAYSMSSANYHIGIGFGHDPYGYAVGQLSSGSFGFTRFNSASMDMMGTFGSGMLTSPWGNPVLITAPEPSSVVGMVVGLWVLGRRRRSRATLD